jgi:HK97 family phage portal protein
MTLADAEFLASRAFSVETIARYYRIPLHLLQSTQKTTSWGTGLEQMNQATLTFTVNPWLVNWEQSLGMTLLTAAEQRAGLYFKFNRNALLQATTEARANYYRVMRDIGALSINDVRRREEENDLPDNIGDNYMQPFNGSGGFSKTSGEVMAASTSEEDAQ